MSAPQFLRAGRDPAAVPALVEALEDHVYGVRWLAAQGLINLDKAAVPPLLRALIHHPESGWLREGAHHVLRAIADGAKHDTLAPVIRSLERLGPGPELITTAQQALDTLEIDSDEDIDAWYRRARVGCWVIGDRGVLGDR